MHALEKEMQPTPVFLPGESQGQGSFVGCHLWGRTELDTTEVAPGLQGPQAATGPQWAGPQNGVAIAAVTLGEFCSAV